jgi:hypothetical protein
MLDPAFCVVALFVADDHDRRVVETGKATHHGQIIRKIAIPGQWCVFGEQRLDIVFAMWPVRVTRDLTFAPGR